MYLANLYHIKNTNGLFYYGVDYIKAQHHIPDCILVRPIMERVVAAQLPNAHIVACSLPAFVVRVLKAWWSGKMIYTPSSHPLPFVSKQMVVLHDTYPFTGKLGRLKAWLFVFSARTSRCLLAYINATEGLAFYKQHGFDGDRLVFAPNRFPGAVAKPRFLRPEGETRLIVGLVGTDSPKKNYPALFSAIRRLGRSHEVVLTVYGHATDYFRNLLKRFPDLDIQLIESDHSSLADFLAGLDVLVSVAGNEGFGRPIASALQSGIPCYLIDSPVFREFFDGAAYFSPTVDSLVGQLFEEWSSPDRLTKISFTPPAATVDAFATAAARLDDYSTYAHIS